MIKWASQNAVELNPPTALFINSVLLFCCLILLKSAKYLKDTNRGTYRICNPGLGYTRSARLVDQEESKALSYGFRVVHEETRQSFLECLIKHLMFFMKSESMNITTVNTREMEKKDLQNETAADIIIPLLFLINPYFAMHLLHNFRKSGSYRKLSKRQLLY